MVRGGFANLLTENSEFGSWAKMSFVVITEWEHGDKKDSPKKAHLFCKKKQNDFATRSAITSEFTLT